MAGARIILFTRYPTPGEAKTRLIPALGAEGAAALHRRLTERTLCEMRASGLECEIRYHGASETDFRKWLGEKWTFVPQGDGDLGDKLSRASHKVSAYAPAILIGADCPDLQAFHLLNAAEALRETPVVIGPAEDGGYWLIGLAEPMEFLFEDMEWGTDRVFPETMNRLNSWKINPLILETLSDCDRPEDLSKWPEL